MRDLVETVISQVMRQDKPYPSTRSTSPHVQQTAKSVRTHELTPASRAPGRTPADNDPLWQASRQFETIFVEQMLTSMRKSVPDSGFVSKGFADGIQTSMLDQAIAEAVGKQGRMGIATSLYRQLSQNTQAPSKPADNLLSDAAAPATGSSAEGEYHGAH